MSSILLLMPGRIIHKNFKKKMVQISWISYLMICTSVVTNWRERPASWFNYEIDSKLKMHEDLIVKKSMTYTNRISGFKTLYYARKPSPFSSLRKLNELIYIGTREKICLTVKGCFESLCYAFQKSYPGQIMYNSSRNLNVRKKDIESPFVGGNNYNSICIDMDHKFV